MESVMEAILVDIPDGPLGTIESLHKLSEQSTISSLRVDILQLARDVVSKVDPRDNTEKANELFWWVKKNIKYQKGPISAEDLQAPYVTTYLGYGDCNCMAALLASLNMAVGNAARFVIIGTEVELSYDHIYVEVEVSPERWVAYDPSHPDSEPGWSPGIDQFFHKYVYYPDTGQGEYMSGLFSKIIKEVKRAFRSFERNVIRPIFKEIKRFVEKNFASIYRPISSIARHIRDEKRRLEKRLLKNFSAGRTNLGPSVK